VGDGIRQSTVIDDTKLKDPVGAARILGFLLIIVGLVGVLLSQQLKAEPMWLYASIASFAVGMALAWKRKALA
jgi:MFS transporter, PAT family, beta-lactamase induction signal transducer AmpG